MNRNLIRWFRWLILIPATIGLTVLYAIYVNPVLTQGFGKNIEHALNPFISFALVVLIAYLIAPSYKFKTSLIFGCLSLLLPFVGIIIVLTGIKIGGEEQYVLDGGIAIFTTIAGLAVGLLITWKLNIRSYRFKEPKNTACIVCSHVINRERSILYASHQAEDGFWQFLCGKDDHTEESFKLISLEEATVIGPSINDVHRLPLGSSIARAGETDEWRI